MLEFCTPTRSLCNCYINFDNFEFKIVDMMERLKPYTSHNIPVMRTMIKGIDEHGEPFEKYLENIYPGYDCIINRKKKVVIDEEGNEQVIYVKAKCIHSEITVYVESEHDRDLRLSGNYKRKKYIICLTELGEYLRKEEYKHGHSVNIVGMVTRTTSGLEFKIEYTGKDDGGNREGKVQKILLWQTGKYQLYKCMHITTREEIISWIETLFKYLYKNTDIINDLG
jgi:hypothetical protein